MKKKHSITVILRSCLTGKVVWIYRGPSRAAARKAYWRACRKELERVRNWGERMARRAASIRRLLTDCMADKPIDAELTPEQQQAARELQNIGRKPQDCHLEFYDHIVEERRRRNEDREIRRMMREDKAKQKEK